LGQLPKEMTAYQVGVSAEAFAAALFARAGYHVSVQYGANQPGYDLVVERAKKAFLISVKGSQDGGWGLTQSYLQNADYHGAIDTWRDRHDAALLFCFVQFKDKKLVDMPDVFLARCGEVAEHMKKSGRGLGDTVLWVRKAWKTGRRAGHVDLVPEEWRFSVRRVDELLR
jgi:hypothetical protein